MRRNYNSSKWTVTVALAFCAALVEMFPDVYGIRFITGGNMGWTSYVNYTLWTGNQTFYFGDWLFFVYDRDQDCVLEVSKTNYKTCNGEHPLHNYTRGFGRDVVELNVTHDRYFISSKRSCLRGMKLHIHLSPLPRPPHAAPSKSNFSGLSTLTPPPPIAAPLKSQTSDISLPPPPPVAGLPPLQIVTRHISALYHNSHLPPL
ncbi:early nodulin-like protein 17 [Rutidosis leptorrhynchoides]|uniref:early nodulin-like protein 17 n=1 Tax=Rutidosis leptorrhynchoides TaxID=125765 RepID=UPI003A991636